MKSTRNFLAFALIVVMAGMMVLFTGCGSSGSSGEDSSTTRQSETSDGDAGAGAAKEFSERPWVFDAEYDIPAEVESYTTFGELIRFSDLVVPYINIDSPDGKAANKELYGVYEDLVNTFNECARDAAKYDMSGYSVSDYEAYILDDVVSVIVTQTSGGTDVPWYDYYSYSFSLEDGRLLNYEEACEIAGMTVEQAGEKIEQNIRESTLEDFPDAPDIDSYIAQSIESYEASVNSGTIKFYLHDSALLNVVVEKHFPAGGGKGNEVIPVL